MNLLFIIIAIIAVPFIWGMISDNIKTEDADDSIPDHIYTTDTYTSDIRINVYTNKTINNSTTKELNNPAKYSIIHKNGSFKDNMNYNLYSVKTRSASTNRMRTNEIGAFDEKEVIETMHKQGYIGDIEIQQIPFPDITEAQREYCQDLCQEENRPFYSDMCKYDISYYISQLVDHDSVPNPDLIEFATNRKMKFSYYIGKKSLYNLVFNCLEPLDQIAFFAFSIYRYNSSDRNGNMDKSIHKDVFYELARQQLNNDSFIKSLHRYRGEDLRFFGKMSVNGWEVTGGSKATIAYKTTFAFLHEERLI